MTLAIVHPGNLDGDLICRRDEERAMQAYHPGDRPRRLEWIPDEWGRLFLGGSALVKRTATDYQAYIEAKRVEESSDGGFWGKQGNKAAEAHFNEFTDYQEIQVRCPLNSTHDLVGHIDAIIVYDAAGNDISRHAPQTWPPRIYLVVGEHKLQDPGDEDEASGNVDLARRQAVLYLSWLRHQLAAGVRHFPLGSDEADRAANGKSNSRPFTIPPHCEAIAERVSVRHWSRSQPPARVRTEVIDSGLLSQVEDRYRRKALAIHAGGEAALAWDNSPEGLREFKLTLTAQEAGVQEDDLARHVLGYALGLLREREWGGFKAASSANACAALVGAGVRKVRLQDPVTGELWGLPSVRGNAGGKGLTLLPNLRGEWSVERLEETLKKLNEEKL